MSWEWRMFYSDGKYNPLNTLRAETARLQEKLNKTQPKARNDYYFNLQDSAAGLKERWEKRPPQLELKVMQKQAGEIEYWEKCMARPLKDTVDEHRGIDLETVKCKIQEELNNPKLAKSAKSSSKMLEIISLLKDNLPPRIKIQKKRWQIRALLDEETVRWNFFLERLDDPNTLVIERTELSFYREGTQIPEAFITICVEGRNIEHIERFIEAFIRREKEMVMGYPEFLARNPRTQHFGIHNKIACSEEGWEQI